MTSVICQSFVQNTWRKDLCSNCFKSEDEHKLSGLPNGSNVNLQDPMCPRAARGILSESEQSNDESVPDQSEEESGRKRRYLGVNVGVSGPGSIYRRYYSYSSKGLPNNNLNLAATTKAVHLYNQRNLVLSQLCSMLDDSDGKDEKDDYTTLKKEENDDQQKDFDKSDTNSDLNIEKASTLIEECEDGSIDSVKSRKTLDERLNGNFKEISNDYEYNTKVTNENNQNNSEEILDKNTSLLMVEKSNSTKSIEVEIPKENANSTEGILKANKKNQGTKPKLSLTFSDALEEVIGYGGINEDPNDDSEYPSDEYDEDSDSDNFDELDDQSELSLLTKSNTDANARIKPLPDNDDSESGKGSKQVKLRRRPPLVTVKPWAPAPRVNPVYPMKNGVIVSRAPIAGAPEPEVPILADPALNSPRWVDPKDEMSEKWTPESVDSNSKTPKGGKVTSIDDVIFGPTSTDEENLGKVHSGVIPLHESSSSIKQSNSNSEQNKKLDNESLPSTTLSKTTTNKDSVENLQTAESKISFASSDNAPKGSDNIQIDCNSNSHIKLSPQVNQISAPYHPRIKPE